MRADFACLDGSPFPVTFGDAGDVELPWSVDREHAPTAMTPLADAVRREGDRGSRLAYEECGLKIPSTSRPPPRANGYEYMPDLDLPAEEGAAFVDGIRRLGRDHGGTMGVWLNCCLPRVQGACARLREAPVETPFRVLADDRCYAWSLTAVAGIVARFDLQALAAVCGGGAGSDDAALLLAHRLAQGFANDTTAADVDLARLALIDEHDPAAEEAGRRFLAEYGEQTTSWPIDHPTLGERPDLLDAQLRLLRREARVVSTLTQAAADRRRHLAAEVRARLDSDEARSTFDRRLARMDAFVPVREGRARWQLIASGAMRGAVLRRGRHLVSLGVIDEVDDVFFLTPAEYDEPDRPLQATVADRRVDHRHWTEMTPPPQIGRGVTPTKVADDVLRAIAGAPGRITATARVITDLAQAERLGGGEVLVTTMTSPPWTPLFGIAGAVVTDSGDPMSHSAIAAREYGIPCVVGTHHGTVAIRDGSRVTVDGDAGTVHLDA